VVRRSATPDRQLALETEVRDLARTHPDLAGRSEFELPYVKRTYVSNKEAKTLATNGFLNWVPERLEALEKMGSKFKISMQFGCIGGPQSTYHKNGAVADCAVLLDRVMHPDPGHADWEALRARLVERFHRAVFPPAAGETVLTQPVAFGSLPAGAG